MNGSVHAREKSHELSVVRGNHHRRGPCLPARLDQTSQHSLAGGEAFYRVRSTKKLVEKQQLHTTDG